jgi:membrane fusion protein, multidrug efflux system
MRARCALLDADRPGTAGSRFRVAAAFARARSVAVPLVLPVSLLLLDLWPCPALAQAVEVAKVTSRRLERTILLPGELRPYQEVELQARLAGFVERVEVDRGSTVKKGQVLVKLTAPEIAAQVAEAESKLRAAEAQRTQATAKLAADQSTYEQLKAASETKGAVSGRELIQAQKDTEAAQALVESLNSAVAAAESSWRAARQMEEYLVITAPFDGVITERMVHPGALVGPGGESGVLLKLEQLSRLRLLVAVPEAEYAGVVQGAQVEFTVPAHKAQKFSATVARVSHSMDPKTRSMPVELDVSNPAGALAPGMYPEVSWPTRRPLDSLLVPPTSIVTTTERTFVIRVRNGKAEWVDVRKGVSAGGDLVEVTGNLQPGDTVVRRGSDEIRDGTAIQVQGGKG